MLQAVVRATLVVIGFELRVALYLLPYPASVLIVRRTIRHVRCRDSFDLSIRLSPPARERVPAKRFVSRAVLACLARSCLGGTG